MKEGGRERDGRKEGGRKRGGGTGSMGRLFTRVGIAQCPHHSVAHFVGTVLYTDASARDNASHDVRLGCHELTRRMIYANIRGRSFVLICRGNA